MPHAKDPGNGGTEADGSKNTMYCSYCYRDGEFLSKDITTAKEMQAFCMEKMQEQGMSKIVAWLFTRMIPKLDRWNK